jgi:regulator of sirC expression with transglutaminase-like and TPR domain
VLNTLGVQTSYYLPQSFSEKKQWDRAIFVLSVATEISPEKPFVWYSRAEAYARKGDRKRALADLHQAVDTGWNDLASLQQDEAFAPLHQDPEYQRLTAALEPRKPKP